MCIILSMKIDTVLLSVILVVLSFEGEYHEKMAYTIDFTSFTLM
jgi:hypothetical protein